MKVSRGNQGRRTPTGQRQSPHSTPDNHLLAKNARHSTSLPNRYGRYIGRVGALAVALGVAAAGAAGTAVADADADSDGSQSAGSSTSSTAGRDDSSSSEQSQTDSTTGHSGSTSSGTDSSAGSSREDSADSDADTAEPVDGESEDSSLATDSTDGENSDDDSGTTTESVVEISSDPETTTDPSIGIGDDEPGHTTTDSEAPTETGPDPAVLESPPATAAEATPPLAQSPTRADDSPAQAAGARIGHRVSDDDAEEASAPPADTTPTAAISVVADPAVTDAGTTDSEVARDPQIARAMSSAALADVDAESAAPQSIPAKLVAAVLAPLVNPAPAAPALPSLVHSFLGWIVTEIRRTLCNQTPNAVDQQVVVELEEPSDVSDPIAFDVSDPDSEILTFSVPANGEPGGPSHGTVTVDQTTGAFIYDPDDDFAITGGTDTFAYTVSDANSGFHLHGLFGFLKPGWGHTDTATVTITVTPTAVNEPPVANDDTLTVAEDGTASIDVLSNDTDRDNPVDEFSVAVVAGPTHGLLTETYSGLFSYTPNADYNGPDSFTYAITDPAGATDTATVSITVTPVNDAPIAGDDTVTTAEDTPVTIDLLANDIDIDNSRGELTVTIDSGPLRGTLTPDGTGTIFTYTPAANFSANDSFTYTVADPDGATDTATVSITVTPVNDAPIARDDTVTTTEDTPVTIDVLANDADIDDRPSDLTVTVGIGPANGTLAVNGEGLLTYTPDDDYSGDDSFTYTVADPDGATATATVSITVTPVNDPPIAGDDDATVIEGQPRDIGVLANDYDVDDGLDVTSLTIVQAPTSGTATVNPDGTITYQSTDANVTADSFAYTIADLSGAIGQPATVNLTVIAEPAELEASFNIGVAVYPNQIDLNGTDATVVDDGIAITNREWDLTDADGNTVASGSGNFFSYLIVAPYNGPYALTLTVTDNLDRQGSSVQIIPVFTF